MKKSQSLTKINQLFVKAGRKQYPVDSLEDASLSYRGFIDAANLGSSEVPVEYSAPLVVDADGKTIGYIAYNGNIFAGLPSDWRSGTMRLYDATGYYPESGAKSKSKKPARRLKQSGKTETQMRGLRRQ